jgi:S-methylmethionine-dependent homocysteine/selenocysteine methylase
VAFAVLNALTVNLRQADMAIGDWGRAVEEAKVAKYRYGLPQVDGDAIFLTDSGLETDLIFHEGFDLPLFASFVLLDDEKGVEALRNYFLRHIEVAHEANARFLFEAPTWRANIEWARQLGYDEDSLADVNRRAVDLGVRLREETGEEHGPFVISAAIGPRGDAYNPDWLMTAEEAESYHSAQIATLAGTEADLITALTVTYPGEAIGVVRAAATHAIPAVISFTVETDGRLPNGSSLGEAIAMVDEATAAGPAYYGINCAHPTHFMNVLDGSWTQRLKLIRANASRLSHAELDEAEELDDGDPEAFGAEYMALRQGHPQINVLGGCCGTDVRHVRSIAAATRSGSR